MTSPSADTIERARALRSAVVWASNEAVEIIAQVLHDAQEEARREQRETIEQLKGTLRYIHTQAKSRPSGDALTLSVIERNAHAALNDGFQAAVLAAIRNQEPST